MKNSDYFVPPTQCNAAGVPQVRTVFVHGWRRVRVLTLSTQGGYLDMSAFIAEQGFKTGKGGYQKVRSAAGVFTLISRSLSPPVSTGLPAAVRPAPGRQHAVHVSRCRVQLQEGVVG